MPEVGHESQNADGPVFGLDRVYSHRSIYPRSKLRDDSLRGKAEVAESGDLRFSINEIQKRKIRTGSTFVFDRSALGVPSIVNLTGERNG